MRQLACFGVVLCFVLTGLAFGQDAPAPRDLPAIDRPAEPCPYPFPHEPSPPEYDPPIRETADFDQWEFDAELFRESNAEGMVYKKSAPSPCSLPAKAQHLLEAANHLEAAGLVEQARLLRERAKKEELSPLLAKKIKQLESLQAEIQHLRQITGIDERQIVLEVRVLEVPLGMVRALGFPAGHKGNVKTAPHKPRKGNGQRPGLLFEVLDETKKLNEIIAALRKVGALKVIAEPTLITTSGRRATFWSGGEFPVVVPAGLGEMAVEFVKFGVSLDVLPVLQGEGKISLNLRHSVSSRNHAHSITLAGRTVPGLHKLDIDTNVMLKLGQTVCLACTSPSHKARNVHRTSGKPSDVSKNDVLILITPKLVDLSNPPKEGTGPIVRQPEKSWWRLWR